MFTIADVASYVHGCVLATALMWRSENNSKRQAKHSFLFEMPFVVQSFEHTGLSGPHIFSVSPDPASHLTVGELGLQIQTRVTVTE